MHTSKAAALALHAGRLVYHPIYLIDRRASQRFRVCYSTSGASSGCSSGCHAHLSADGPGQGFSARNGTRDMQRIRTTRYSAGYSSSSDDHQNLMLKVWVFRWL